MSAPANVARPVYCYGDFLSAADQRALSAACQGLALHANNPPTGMIAFVAGRVGLICDQGTPFSDPTVLAARMNRNPPAPPKDYVSLTIQIPTPGASLGNPAGTCAPPGPSCLPLSDGQAGYEMRRSWSWEEGSSSVADIMVAKPTVEITVTRNYAYNHGEIEQAQMIADEHVLIRALSEVDTATGFRLITSTAP